MKNKYCDLTYKLIIMLSLEYILFFAIEVIFPGLIVEVFNINLLLLGVLFLIGILIIKGGKCTSILADNIYTKIFLSLVFIFLLGINFIALYKIPIILVTIYLVIILVAGWFLWKRVDL